MPSYVWRNGHLVDKETGADMVVPQRKAVCRPRVQSDIAEYRSPIDGKPISGRAAQREDLKKHDCVLSPPPPKHRGYSNPTFAKRRGLTLTDKVRDEQKI